MNKKNLILLALTTKMPKVKQESNVFHHALRWSVDHTDDNKDELVLWLKDNADKWVFQAELTNHEGHANPHYQGYFHTKDKQRSKALAINANVDLAGVNIQPSSSNGVDALRKYCMKEDSRVAGPWADKKLYLGNDLWSFSEMPNWQKSLLTLLRRNPGNRKMYWLYDPIGNIGKTKFVKYLVYKQNALGLGYGHSTDVLNLVSKMPNLSVYIWNLTRAKPANLSELDLYSAMESVKDGYFINLKYETSIVLMDPPHVVVMANHLPTLKHISADRWQMLGVNNGNLVKLTTLGEIVPIVPIVL